MTHLSVCTGIDSFSPGKPGPLPAGDNSNDNVKIHHRRVHPPFYLSYLFATVKHCPCSNRSIKGKHPFYIYTRSPLRSSLRTNDKTSTLLRGPARRGHSVKHRSKRTLKRTRADFDECSMALVLSFAFPSRARPVLRSVSARKDDCT